MKSGRLLIFKKIQLCEHLKRLSTQQKKHLLIWGAFCIFFTYFWRTYDLFNHMPAHGDALEVIWGIIWYNHAFTNWINPLHYPYIFHPEGWQVGILAHPPLFFILAQPLYFIGGEVFAYNILGIIPFFISYIGALRFFKHYTKSTSVLIAVSLAFTFVAMRSTRIWGHLHILWATSFLPLWGDQLIKWRQAESETIWNKHVLRSGLYWGLMINFSLYSVFLGPFMFLLLGTKLLQSRKIFQIVLVGSLGLLVGSLALLPYYLATQHEPTNPARFPDLVHWSTSLNGIFMPHIFHDIPLLNRLANNFFHSPVGGEARTFNFGLTTLVFLLVGLWALWRKRGGNLTIGYGHILVFAFALIFSFGPLVKIDGEVVESKAMTGVTTALWELGYQMKPEVFLERERGPDIFIDAIPLPSFL